MTDVPLLQTLIERSVRELQSADYTPRQIDGALESVFGVDTQLVAAGTYFVVQTQDLIVACGGWSKRRTLYGGDQWIAREDDLLDPERDAAKIRAFFVHPDWIRRGIGTLLLDACEDAAHSLGFHRFEMGATLTGVPLYTARGYATVERLSVSLKNGESLPIVRMTKRFSST